VVVVGVVADGVVVVGVVGPVVVVVVVDPVVVGVVVEPGPPEPGNWVGAPPGGAGPVPPSTWTESNVAVLVTFTLCEVTARPARRLPARPGTVFVDPDTFVQLRPSVEVMAVNVDPERSAST
jgi:hypothetical protein